MSLCQFEKAIFLSFVIIVATPLLCAQQALPAGVKFEVISLRLLSDKEAAERSPDFVGPNVAVRLRLTTSDHGVDFYGWENSPLPAGYRIQHTDHGAVWLYGKGGTEKKTSSPGLKTVLFGSRGAWIILPSHSAIEWEELDSTLFAGERHSYTAFIKQRDADPPLEIFSDPFTIPSRPTSTMR